jgi:hypothetical protein
METLLVVWCTCVHIRDTARWFLAIPHLLLPYDQCSYALGSPEQISSWPSLHNRQSLSAMKTVYMIIEFQWQNIRRGVTDVWQSCRFRQNIILVQTHLRLASQCISDCDTTRVFMTKLCLSLCGMSSPMIEVQAQLRSAILSRMTFFDFYEANVGKLQLSRNISFQVTHATTATISLQSACTPPYSAYCSIVCFILIMDSSA